jgi:hypothetical protein
MKQWFIVAGIVLTVVVIGGVVADSANEQAQNSPAKPVDQHTVCMNAWYWYTYKASSELTPRESDLIGACRTLGRLTKSGEPEP